jgi:broad specificity phosphatase PhoE
LKCSYSNALVYEHLYGPVCFPCDTVNEIIERCDDENTSLEELIEIVDDIKSSYKFKFGDVEDMTKPEIKKKMQDYMKKRVKSVVKSNKMTSGEKKWLYACI